MGLGKVRAEQKNVKATGVKIPRELIRPVRLDSASGRPRNPDAEGAYQARFNL
jgi:hypothetical protein